MSNTPSSHRNTLTCAFVRRGIDTVTSWSSSLSVDEIPRRRLRKDWQTLAQVAAKGVANPRARRVTSALCEAGAIRLFASNATRVCPWETDTHRDGVEKNPGTTHYTSRGGQSRRSHALDNLYKPTRKVGVEDTAQWLSCFNGVARSHANLPSSGMRFDPCHQ